MFAPVALLAVLLTPQSATHGAMVGCVGPESAMVWVRADGACGVQVRYGTAPGDGMKTQSDEVTAGADTDFTVRIVLKGLKPATEYHYQVMLTRTGAAVAGPKGRFRTAPAAGTAAAFTMAFSGDVVTTGEDPMWPRIAAQKPDVYVSLGDMPYADNAKGLAGYRLAHQKVREHKALHEFFQNVPVVPVWDDHEVGNDWDAEVDAQRVAAATQAWREYMPVAEGAPIYRSFRWGAGVEVFVLDCRSMRGRNEDPDVPGRSMLGAAQVEWLTGALGTSTATFKLVCSSVPLRFGTTAKDSWQGYQRERDAILAELEARGVDGVVFLAADQHWAAVHAHNEGRAEFQVGPLAAGLREPPTVPEAQVRFVSKQLSFGVVAFDPKAQPPMLTVSIHGVNGEVHRSTIAAGRPARVQVEGAPGNVRLVPAEGGLAMVARGAQVVWPRVAAGEHQLRLGSGTAGSTEPMPLQLGEGARASVAVGSAAQAPVLLRDDFDVERAMTVADAAGRGGPSAWFTSGGVLWQSSGIGVEPARAEDPFAPGTVCVRGSREWTDVEVRARVWTAGAGTVGVLFRYQDAANCCRVVWNGKRKARRLEAVGGGKVTVLAEDQAELTPYRWYEVAVRAIGEGVEVWIDGAQVFTASHHAGHGAVALATGDNELAAFDDLEVREMSVGGVGGPVLDATTTLVGWSEPAGGAPGPRWKTGTVLRGVAQAGAEPVLLRTDVVQDGRVAVRARWLGGEVGLMARVSGPGDCYELRWDGRKVTLQRRIGGGKPWVIGTAKAEGGDGLFHELALQCAGFRLEAWFDDAPVVREMDGAHTAGRCGLFASDGGSGEFSGFRVLPAAVPLPVLATVVDKDGSCEIRASCPGAPGGAYALALWLERTHPALPGASGRGPALLVAGAEPMFLLGGSKRFEGAIGELDRRGWLKATFAARGSALRGQVVLVGGFVLDAAGQQVQSELPRAATIL